MLEQRLRPRVTFELSKSACAHAVALDRRTFNKSLCFLSSPPPCPAPPLPVNAENSSSDQRQACKKHELYVSFRDLGWQVRASPCPPLPPPGGQGCVPHVQGVTSRSSPTFPTTLVSSVLTRVENSGRGCRPPS